LRTKLILERLRLRLRLWLVEVAVVVILLFLLLPVVSLVAVRSMMKMEVSVLPCSNAAPETIAGLSTTVSGQCLQE
jgi:hypothetical protein